MPHKTIVREHKTYIVGWDQKKQHGVGFWAQYETSLLKLRFVGKLYMVTIKTRRG